MPVITVTSKYKFGDATENVSNILHLPRHLELVVKPETDQLIEPILSAKASSTNHQNFVEKGVT